jgi:hypothetical protein
MTATMMRVSAAEARAPARSTRFRPPRAALLLAKIFEKEVENEIEDHQKSGTKRDCMRVTRRVRHEMSGSYRFTLPGMPSVVRSQAPGPQTFGEMGNQAPSTSAGATSGAWVRVKNPSESKAGMSPARGLLDSLVNHRIRRPRTQAATSTTRRTPAFGMSARHT